ncbi:fumarylacetoacetate hydrolase family protein [Gleimia hominis]|uniref:fumarylacetoacetate hydrolase family protein n=1 Tax=Gleimia hominis TaxID=595468 RepID=UPI000C7FF2DD|nr:fumarylacetoacetate hydrolase family protein [Gleimia hominis]WIK65347.1 fumarylacetoacetate hydrolase family protein [Gleimia hominis]
MKVVRFKPAGNPRYGVLEEGSSRILGLKGDPLFQQVEPSGEFFEVDEVRLLSPVIPRSKVVGVGRNYADHAHELGNEVPQDPILFFKPNTSVIGPDDPIVLPPWSNEVHYEAELAVVVKTLCKDVAADRAKDYILGYTVANDVSARDVQRSDNQWARAKGFDTSCPLGPWITVDPDLDPHDLDISTTLNGQVVQTGNTRDMLVGVGELIEYITHAFTLLPGDVILTGTPAGVGPMQAGDRVECTISQIGTLGNFVVRR